MLYAYEHLARERAREAESAAAHARVVNRMHAAQRWHRLAAWSAHRSAMADRAVREEYVSTEPTA